MRPGHLRWLVALGFAGAAFWAGPGVATQAMKVKLGMPTTPPNAVHITPWVAKDQGFFAEEGLDVEIATQEHEPDQLFLVVVAPERKLAAEPAKYHALIRALAKAKRFMYANRGRTVEIAAKYTQLPRDILEEAYAELVRGRVWAQNDGLPREKVEERPRYVDYVAVSLVQEALRSLARGA